MPYQVDVVKIDPVVADATVTKVVLDVNKAGRQYVFSYNDFKNTSQKIYTFSDDFETVTETYLGKVNNIVFVMPDPLKYDALKLPKTTQEAVDFEGKLDDILIKALIDQGYGKYEKF